MRTLFALFAFLCLIPVSGQDQLEYQQPPEEILELATAPLAPYVWMTDNGKYMLMLYRSAYKSIEELSQPEMRLAGLRINPKTNTGSRTTFYNNLELQVPGESGTRPVTGLPPEPRLADFSLSPDEEKLALTHTTATGVELWVVELATATARRLTGPRLNANLRDVVNWFGDSKALLVKTLPADREALVDRSEVVPTGPTIATNDGKKAQNRTYQDLIKNPDDAFNFEQLARSGLTRVSLDGTSSEWMEPGMYRNISFSPDGNYVMVTTVEKPFSYLVPYYRFPSRTAIYTKGGALVETVLEVPLIEDLPKGFMAERTGMRDLSWRSDQPATLVYAEALDGGDPAVEVPFRDQVFTLEAPFKGPGKPLLKTRNRYSGITWGTDQVAIARDYWWNNRNTKTYRFNPSDPHETPVVLSDRNYQDRYSDPGNFVTRRNEWNREVLALDRRGRAFLLGDGYSEEGQFPFLDRMDLGTAEIWNGDMGLLNTAKMALGMDVHEEAEEEHVKRTPL